MDALSHGVREASPGIDHRIENGSALGIVGHAAHVRPGQHQVGIGGRNAPLAERLRWCLLVARAGSWLVLVARGCSWLLLEPWWVLVARGAFWWLMVAIGGSCGA